MGRLIVFLIFVYLPFNVSAADCPPLLNAALPTLSDDRPESLCKYQGKVVLAVNTASQCGYTPQYEGLEKLHRRYKDKGLVVLGFPSNDFGAQEPGSNKEIARFCEVNYGVTFPMFAKTGVSGSAANPFFARLAKASGSRPQWNFHKYLVDRSGAKVVAFDTRVEPSDPKLIAEVERMLNTKGDKP
jgi:glutathione peroxidase